MEKIIDIMKIGNKKIGIGIPAKLKGKLIKST